jgi:hypothetical protein
MWEGDEEKWTRRREIEKQAERGRSSSTRNVNYTGKKKKK